MRTDTDLKKLERTVWCLFHFKDGLWDIMLGAVIIYLGGYSVLTSDNIKHAYLILPSLLVVLLGKSLITNRRIGQAHFKKERTHKIAISFTAVAILVIIIPFIAQQFEIDTKIYWNLCGTNCNVGIPVYGSYGIALMAASAFACFSMLAFALDTKRLYLYGVLYTIAVILRETIDRPFGNLSFSIAGFIIILTGLIMFLRFLKKYPPLDPYSASIGSAELEDNTNIRQAEKENRTVYSQDGFLDIFMGLLVIGMGIIWITGSKWPYLIWGVALLCIVAGRRLITIPRVGHIKFGPELEKKPLVIVALITISLSLGIALMVLTSTGMYILHAVLAIISGLPYVIFFLSFMAYLMVRARLFGLLVLVALVLGILNDTLLSAIFFTFGSAALIVGLVLLTRFIRRYPRMTNIQDIERESKSNA